VEHGQTGLRREAGSISPSLHVFSTQNDVIEHLYVRRPSIGKPDPRLLRFTPSRRSFDRHLVDADTLFCAEVYDALFADHSSENPGPKSSLEVALPADEPDGDPWPGCAGIDLPSVVSLMFGDNALHPCGNSAVI